MKLDGEFVKKLERLNVLAKRVAWASGEGERIGRAKGASLEFADHRSYTPGDDIRYIDWNIFARRDQLFIKEFFAEESVHVAVAFDSSRSMGCGSPSKLECAKLIAAALSYIGLSNFDTVSLYSFADGMTTHRQFVRGKRMIFEFLKDIDGVPPAGETDLRRAFETPPRTIKGKSVLFIVSDLFDRDDWRAGLSRLAVQSYQVNLIHVLSRDDIEPAGRGRLLLTDAENGERERIELTSRSAKAYRKALDRFLADIESFAMEKEFQYVRTVSSDPIEKIVAEIARKGLILGRRS